MWTHGRFELWTERDAQGSDRLLIYGIVMNGISRGMYHSLLWIWGGLPFPLNGDVFWGKPRELPAHPETIRTVTPGYLLHSNHSLPDNVDFFLCQKLRCHKRLNYDCFLFCKTTPVPRIFLWLKLCLSGEALVSSKILAARNQRNCLVWTLDFKIYSVRYRPRKRMHLKNSCKSDNLLVSTLPDLNRRKWNSADNILYASFETCRPGERYKRIKGS
jgi:hypothetical protein